MAIGTRKNPLANQSYSNVVVTDETIVDGYKGLGTVVTGVDGAAIPVSLAAPPAGGATEAKQDVGNASLASIAAEDFATQATLALIKTKIDNIDVPLSTRTKPSDTQPVSIASMPSTPVTGPLTDAQLRASAVPVSGTFFQATQPVSAVSLPLPTNASFALPASKNDRSGAIASRR